ncbi:MAG TPA: hypothetical protein PK992_00485, partial [Planctomycetaceae bacterium]|nr:hypothetical protein [Planctomycetaceae bacterium]
TDFLKKTNRLSKTIVFCVDQDHADQITQYVADTVKTLYTSTEELRKQWSDFEQRSVAVEKLEERGIDFQEL